MALLSQSNRDGILIIKKESLKAGDIVEHWGMDLTPNPWYKRLYWLVFRGFSFVSFLFRNHISGRIKYGFPPYEGYDFVSHHSKWCAKRLKFFKKNGHGHPELSCEDPLKKWHDILDKMIWSFENIGNEPEPIRPPNYDGRHRVVKHGDSIAFKNVDSRPWDWTPVEEHRVRVQEGLDLFAKYYISLWD